jgi:hypothetical protein
VDSMGIWKLDGLDLEILNSAKPPGTLRIRDVANLNAIVASVDPGKPATFKSILASAPPSEVVARLKLPSSARVTAITEDPVERTFYPGNYTQPLATYVRCRIPFADDIDEPILRMRSFGGDTIPDFKFDAHKYNELTLTMSNLCKCVDEKEYSEKEHGEREYKKRMNDPDNIIDDPEFSVYNMLLAGTGLTRFPVPTIPLRHGAVRIPLCFSPAQAEV